MTIKLPPNQQQIAERAVNALWQHLRASVFEKFRHLGVGMPTSLGRFAAQSALQICIRDKSPTGVATVDGELASILCLAAHYYLQEQETELEWLKTDTQNVEILAPKEELRDKARSLVSLVRGNTSALMPHLGDYVSLGFAAEQLPSLSERIYDEKFSTLMTPTLIDDDLSFYREHCGLRNTTVAVAFVDIDSFKDYNSKLGNTKVDRVVLPPLMRVLEAFVFGRGFAYRHGGDEYVLIMPNVKTDEAGAVFEALCKQVRDTKYGDNVPGVTVSVGYTIAARDTYLTNSQILKKAEEGASRAKKAGRNRACPGDSDQH